MNTLRSPTERPTFTYLCTDDSPHDPPTHVPVNGSIVLVSTALPELVVSSNIIHHPSLILTLKSFP